MKKNPCYLSDLWNLRKKLSSLRSKSLAAGMSYEEMNLFIKEMSIAIARKDVSLKTKLETADTVSNNPSFHKL